MSTAVFELHPARHPTLHRTQADEKSPRKGFFQRFAENRERHAQSRIRSFLLGRSDAGLAALGFTPAEISVIRATGVIPASFWR